MDKTDEVVRRQIVAMGGTTFEIGLFKSDATERARSTMILRTYAAEAVFKVIPWLKFENYYGRNIFVRPYGEHNLSMVDDLSADSIRRMKGCGFAPALVIETSPGNFQAWLKHPRVLPKELSTAWPDHSRKTSAATQVRQTGGILAGWPDLPIENCVIGIRPDCFRL